MVTGSDPTSIPLAGIIAPFAGAAATGLVGEFIAASRTTHHRGAPEPDAA